MCSRRAAPATKSKKKEENKGLSYSIREGIGKKMKYRENPYEMKGWEKCSKFTLFENIFHNSDVLQSNLDFKKSFRINFSRSI